MPSSLPPSLSKPACAAQDIVLDGEDLELLSVSIDDEPLADGDYHRTDTGLTLLNAAQCIVSTRVRILPHQNTQLSGLYCSNNTFCTQCEAEGFRRITYFFDRPDVMTTFRCRISAKKSLCPLLLSNGNRIRQ